MMTLYEVSRTCASLKRGTHSGEFISGYVLASDEEYAIDVMLDNGNFGTWVPVRDDLEACKVDMDDELYLCASYME